MAEHQNTLLLRIFPRDEQKSSAEWHRMFRTKPVRHYCWKSRMIDSALVRRARLAVRPLARVNLLDIDFRACSSQNPPAGNLAAEATCRMQDIRDEELLAFARRRVELVVDVALKFIGHKGKRGA